MGSLSSAPQPPQRSENRLHFVEVPRCPGKSAASAKPPAATAGRSPDFIVFDEASTVPDSVWGSRIYEKNPTDEPTMSTGWIDIDNGEKHAWRVFNHDYIFTNEELAQMELKEEKFKKQRRKDLIYRALFIWAPSAYVAFSLWQIWNGTF